jgi:predicted alternative tryptophan synthase beta-subunit
MKTIEIIQKEQIRDLKFCKKEVLADEMAKIRRNFDLMRAQALGNLLKNKVNITFETADEKSYRVNTTVWAVGTDFVCLKSDIHIPINAITEVD